MDTLLARRRQRRRDSTSAEAALWRHLRAHWLAGFQFRRQHSCGPFIVDFYCASRKLAIDVDGGQHFEPATQAYDARRTSYLVARGITVLRFSSDVVLREMEGVLTVIGAVLGIESPP